MIQASTTTCHTKISHISFYNVCVPDSDDFCPSLI